jgi:hypothetical protein
MKSNWSLYNMDFSSLMSLTTLLTSVSVQQYCSSHIKIASHSYIPSIWNLIHNFVMFRRCIKVAFLKCIKATPFPWRNRKKIVCKVYMKLQLYKEVTLTMKSTSSQILTNNNVYLHHSFPNSHTHTHIFTKKDLDMRWD